MSGTPLRLRFDVDASAASSISGSSISGQANVHIFGPLLEGWSMRQPLPVCVERDGEGYIVSDAIFNVYGQAASWDGAVQDYKSALVDYYQIMAEGDDLPTRRVAEHLRTYIAPPSR